LTAAAKQGTTRQSRRRGRRALRQGPLRAECPRRKVSPCTRSGRRVAPRSPARSRRAPPRHSPQPVEPRSSFKNRAMSNARQRWRCVRYRRGGRRQRLLGTGRTSWNDES
jgi:hypothetical protein